MRGVWLGLCAGIIALSLYLPVAAGSGDVDQATEIVQALETSGAAVTDVQARASIPLEEASATKELVYIAENWGKTLSLPVEMRPSRQNGMYVWENASDFGGYRMSLRVVGVPQGQRWDTHVVVTIEGKRSHLQDIVSLSQKIRERLRHVGIVPQFSTCIRGIYSDTLSDGQQERMIAGLLRSLRANETERLHDETVTSVSAYTDRWKQYLVTGNRRMNVQVATHVDVQQRLTRVTVGTPIITAEY